MILPPDNTVSDITGSELRDMTIIGYQASLKIQVRNCFLHTLKAFFYQETGYQELLDSSDSKHCKLTETAIKDVCFIMTNHCSLKAG